MNLLVKSVRSANPAIRRDVFLVPAVAASGNCYYIGGELHDPPRRFILTGVANRPIRAERLQRQPVRSIPAGLRMV